MAAPPPDDAPPTIAAIESARRRLRGYVRQTPTVRWTSDQLDARVGAGTEVALKLELMQVTGSFKPRAAFTVMLDLTPEQRGRGVTAMSAGNHAIAVAHAARTLRTQAKVVMPKTANPLRVQRTRDLGAEVVLVDDVHAAMATVQRLEEGEGRTVVHPFEGPQVALGSATLGIEWLEQAPDVEALIVPIGGGGLCAGIAAAVKAWRPDCRIFGVEPEGADSMHRSFAAGAPRKIEKVATIADSLGAPYALPYSFGLCRRFVDELVMVSDDEICRALALLYLDMKLAVEPAGAAATAALLGPLRERLGGRKVGVLVCGANLDGESYSRYLARGTALL